MTMAGHVVQGLSECFCGLVIHQLACPGAPFIMGMGAAVLDMATSQCSYNAPEYYMAYMAMIEMSHHVNLPSWGYAGTSDAQIPDGQACFEAGLLTFMSAMAGANLNHDVGYLDFGRTGSLEMIVIVDEMIDLIRRMKKGIPIDDETMALDVIREVGPAGEFLSHEHTYKHLRSTQWRPKLICRSGYEEWGSLRKAEPSGQGTDKITRNSGNPSSGADPGTSESGDSSNHRQLQLKHLLHGSAFGNIRRVNFSLYPILVAPFFDIISYAALFVLSKMFSRASLLYSGKSFIGSPAMFARLHTGNSESPGL